MATAPMHQRPLHDYELDIIRMIAQAKTNIEICAELGIDAYLLRSRLFTIYRLLGVTGRDGVGGGWGRIQLVIWAYDNGLVRPAVEAPEPPQERIPAELAAPMIRLAISILSDEPRGDSKRWARCVMDAARLHFPSARLIAERTAA